MRANPPSTMARCGCHACGCPPEHQPATGSGDATREVPVPAVVLLHVLREGSPVRHTDLQNAIEQTPQLRCSLELRQCKITPGPHGRTDTQRLKRSGTDCKVALPSQPLFHSLLPNTPLLLKSSQGLILLRPPSHLVRPQGGLRCNAACGSIGGNALIRVW